MAPLPLAWCVLDLFVQPATLYTRTPSHEVGVTGCIVFADVTHTLSLSNRVEGRLAKKDAGSFPATR